MWTLDIAREQCPTLEHLTEFAAASLEAGYDSLGLYLEHRFAFPSAPWAQGSGAITPETVNSLQRSFPALRIVPFVNLLGHMEGFLHSEEGSVLRESSFRGMQGCPSDAGFAKFCDGLLEDTLRTFDSDMVHIGGDETWELAKCPKCADPGGHDDWKAELYGRHFGRLAKKVTAAGRQPAVWGDMFLEHPAALNELPRSTVIFDWQYFSGVKESAAKLVSGGFEVVACPTLQTYNSVWAHVEPSEANIREVSQDALDLGLKGVCLTTWECALFGAYDTLLPLVKAARPMMDNPQGAPSFDSSLSAWAHLMGIELSKLGGVFSADGHRNRLKCRLLLYGNPFLAWMHHHRELSGGIGEAALELCARALLATDDEGEKGVTLFVRGAVEFVRIAEAAHRHYANDEPELAVRALAPLRQLFDTLELVANRTVKRIGGSQADAERCRMAKKHVETVITRIQRYGRRELGYLPSFDIITHPHFVPHDQACWWAVNKWGDE